MIQYDNDGRLFLKPSTFRAISEYVTKSYWSTYHNIPKGFEALEPFIKEYYEQPHIQSTFPYPGHSAIEDIGSIILTRVQNDINELKFLEEHKPKPIFKIKPKLRRSLINYIVNIILNNDIRFPHKSEDIKPFIIQYFEENSGGIEDTDLLDKIAVDIHPDVASKVAEQQLGQHIKKEDQLPILDEDYYITTYTEKLPKPKPKPKPKYKSTREYDNRLDQMQINIPKVPRPPPIHEAPPKVLPTPKSPFHNARIETYKLALQPNFIEDISDLPFMQGLDPQQQDIITRNYKRMWLMKHPIEKLSKAHINAFKSHIAKFIKLHLGEPKLSQQQFIRALPSFKRDIRITDDLAYQYYNEIYNEMPGTTFSYTPEDSTNLIGFKGQRKIQALQKQFPNRNVNQEALSQSSHFPLKQNIKKYQTHKIAPRHSYIIDLMFDHEFVYLVAININTKYLFVEAVNQQIFPQEDDIEKAESVKYERLNSIIKSENFINTIKLMIQKGFDGKFLQGDGEGAFKSTKTAEVLKSLGITFQTVPRQQKTVYPNFMRENDPKKAKLLKKTDPLHSSLGIIDRVIRTIRDMAYIMNIGRITPEIMYEIVRQYNNAPHKSLSKWVGFEVTPQMVQEDYQLEEFIIRRIAQENDRIASQPGYKIPYGIFVKVYNESDGMLKRRSQVQPFLYKVIGQQGSLYLVQHGNSKPILVP